MVNGRGHGARGNSRASKRHAKSNEPPAQKHYLAFRGWYVLHASLRHLVERHRSRYGTTFRAPTVEERPEKRSPANPQSGAPVANDVQSLITEAQAALDHNDYAAAIPLLQKIAAQRPEDAVPHFELGYAYSELKRNVDAVAEYRRAIALDPALSAAHINLGLVLLETDPNAAAESFRHAIGLSPDQPRPHYLAGQLLSRRGKQPRPSLSTRPQP